MSRNGHCRGESGIGHQKPYRLILGRPNLRAISRRLDRSVIKLFAHRNPIGLRSPLPSLHIVECFMNFKVFGVLALAAMISIPALAADDAKEKKKKGNRGQANASGQLLKQLKDVGLSDEQIAKVKELGKDAAAKMKKIKDDAGITLDLSKKRQEVAKAMADSEKKGAELAAAINKEAGFSEAHAKALKLVNEVRMEFHKSVVALLDDGQKEKLPVRMKRFTGGKKGKKKGGKGEKKKPAPAAK